MHHAQNCASRANLWCGVCVYWISTTVPWSKKTSSSSACTLITISSHHDDTRIWIPQIMWSRSTNVFGISWSDQNHAAQQQQPPGSVLDRQSWVHPSWIVYLLWTPRFVGAFVTGLHLYSMNLAVIMYFKNETQSTSAQLEQSQGAYFKGSTGDIVKRGQSINLREEKLL